MEELCGTEKEKFEIKRTESDFCLTFLVTLQAGEKVVRRTTDDIQ
jgi:hypothetical protein